MYSFLTDGSTMSSQELSNYVSKNVKDIVQRVDGVSAIETMGGEPYSMRIWLDPMRMTSLGVSVLEIKAAVESQNIQAAAGTLGGEGGSAYLQMKINTMGRLKTEEDFGNIIVRAAPDGSVIRLKDVSKIELGQQEYSASAKWNGAETFALQIYRDSESNAMSVMKELEKVMDEIRGRLPSGVDCILAYNPTEFIGVSMREIIITLVTALILVIIITYLFLQDWRATIIPSLAIPVSLLATFPVMIAVGFSINVLTMFGLILVIGSLVDDAIVVVEGTMSIMEREGLNAKQAAIKCMSQITGAIIATTLVTVACYIPLAFYGGIVGVIYMQFAVTMCIALCFSTLIAMTLSPALCALILRKPPEHAPKFFKPVNAIIDGSRGVYLKAVNMLVRRAGLTLALLVLVFVGIWLIGKQTPSSMLPTEDKGVVLCNVELPPGASLERSWDSIEKFSNEVKNIPGIENVLTVAGFGFLSGAGENAGMLIADLKHWDERKDPSQSAQAIMGKIQEIGAKSVDARIICFTPPAISGLGATGGLSMYLCAEGEVTSEELESVANKFCRDMMGNKGIAFANSTFTANAPQLFLEVDREKAITMGLSPDEIFFTLQSQMASYYINDFNIKGESFYVKMQTLQDERATIEDIMRIQIVSAKTGQAVPLSSIATIRHSTGPKTLSRFNKMSAAQISINLLPGVPSSDIMDIVEAYDFPSGYQVQWTDLSFHEKRNRGRIGPLMALAVLFAYLFLVAQYESWAIPVPVMLTVATATLGAFIGLHIAGQTLSIYAQLGLVMLIGLTAKNAILMVEFSKQERDKGRTIFQAALDGANLRFRAVQMTAWSFLFGVFPLVVATGAGAGSRVAIGVPTFSGMLVATFIGIILTPALYATFQRFREWVKHRFHMKTAAEKYAEEHGTEIDG
jgi:hydrophobe/amphiphile efflux-1 (HAE1) family protein